MSRAYSGTLEFTLAKPESIKEVVQSLAESAPVAHSKPMHAAGQLRYLTASMGLPAMIAVAQDRRCYFGIRSAMVVPPMRARRDSSKSWMSA